MGCQLGQVGGGASREGAQAKRVLAGINQAPLWLSSRLFGFMCRPALSSLVSESRRPARSSRPISFTFGVANENEMRADCAALIGRASSNPCKLPDATRLEFHNRSLAGRKTLTRSSGARQLGGVARKLPVAKWRARQIQVQGGPRFAWREATERLRKSRPHTNGRLACQVLAPARRAKCRARFASPSRWSPACSGLAQPEEAARPETGR